MSEDQITPKQIEADELKAARKKAADQLAAGRKNFADSVKTEPVPGTKSAEQHEADMSQPVGEYLEELAEKANRLGERTGEGKKIKLDNRDASLLMKKKDWTDKCFTKVYEGDEVYSITISPDSFHPETRVTIGDYPSQKNGLPRHQWRKGLDLGETKLDAITNIPELQQLEKDLDQALKQTSDSQK